LLGVSRRSARHRAQGCPAGGLSLLLLLFRLVIVIVVIAIAIAIAIAIGDCCQRGQITCPPLGSSVGHERAVS
jgi:hypothetical protein